MTYLPSQLVGSGLVMDFETEQATLKIGFRKYARGLDISTFRSNITLIVSPNNTDNEIHSSSIGYVTEDDGSKSSGRFDIRGTEHNGNVLANVNFLNMGNLKHSTGSVSQYCPRAIHELVNGMNDENAWDKSRQFILELAGITDKSIVEKT